MKKLDGTRLSAEIRKNLKKETQDLDVKPKLLVVLVGDDPASQVYVSYKEKACKEVGFESDVIKFPASISEEELIESIHGLNQDPEVTGILVQLPLPDSLDSFSVLDSIHPSKDVDCLTPYNQGLLNLGVDFVQPCTPSGIIDLLKANEIELEGKNAVVIGRSNIVGKPMVQLLLKENASVSICHSRTKELKSFTKEADILIVAAGQRHLIDTSFLKESVVVVDVGIHRADTGLVGDVDPEGLSEVASAASPVPGGVGPMTIASLLKNTLSLYYYQHPELTE